jgi:hypothetical protein
MTVEFPAKWTVNIESKTWNEQCFVGLYRTSDKGVFLVGAAHGQAVIDISKAQSGIQWDFAGHLMRKATVRN